MLIKFINIFIFFPFIFYYYFSRVLIARLNFCKEFDNKWVKVFKNEPSKICGRQPLKKIEVIWSASAVRWSLTQMIY